MRIELYLLDKIASFSLPKEILGSFSFDYNPEEESKLINIEARDNKWVLYSTQDSKVFNVNNFVNEVELCPNKFYILRRDEKNYLIYVSELFDNTLTTYTYDQKLNMIIGNTSECNIRYMCEYLSNLTVKINCVNNRIMLEKSSNNAIYVNDKALFNQKYYIKNGDQLNIYGLKIMFLPNLLLINNPGNRVKIDDIQSQIQYYYLNSDEKPKNVEFKDEELYKKDDYFSKAPRIRRIIETKEIRIDPPPRDSENQDLPLILTIGPMLTMGLTSAVTLVSTISKLYSGESDLKDSWTSLVSGGVMLISMLLWPILTKKYNKKRQIRKEKEIKKKYGIYLNEKRKELELEIKLQREILMENLIPVTSCVNIVNNKSINFWDKRIDQNDFLVTRIGVGDEPLDVEIQWPEEGFTIEESELRKEADKVVDDAKYIKNVPISYSFKKNKTTAIMGNSYKCLHFIDNIILQLITFYSYEDLKIVVFTNENNKEHWNYIKYLNHSFTNEKRFRFFSSNPDSNKKVTDYLNKVLESRIQQDQEKNVMRKPYYFVVVDGYDLVKRADFVKVLTEVDVNLGFSLVILENRLSNLPSKCNNFISLGEKTSGILKNSYEKQEQIIFFDEIDYTIDMMDIAKKVSNVPIEFEEEIKQLPDAITFLEMEKIGKVEQLNILNRWMTNDSTTSLRAEIGVGETGDLMYLDLHEKYHGPHGLIAGMTGSGKSEFIITYILSMAINYSPDDVAFILIDYKGGGLAYAFENKTTGVSLPHLAGTITNLDKAEMDRTLVSINSETKRRQRKFNEARDKLGESTIDIYKYQMFYKEGKISEPIPHLFIICDEFAELKSQQPEFMDNLISVARIGRSLGVHLILATQKPSGVVNDQIWSNSKFHVCLKVQDASDSNEMLKKPDAASLKQTGRFYLQVGYDEYFALGQSAWCGAKYYPSDKIVKQVDKSINFIDETGTFIKNIQAGKNQKVEAQGEQLTAIMKNIIQVSNSTNKRVKRLWLENIPPIILIDELKQKYNIVPQKYNVEAILGEYDAPEKQEQGLLKMNFLSQGNTLIYGTDSSEREMLLNTILYSTITSHKTEEINYYIVDYGSEVLRNFITAPQIGGMIFLGEDEKFRNLFKLINTEIRQRKKMFLDYGGEFKNYNKQNENKLPLITIVLNNYEGIVEINQNLSEDLIPICRDCERYGINFIITCNRVASIGRRIGQSFNNIYSLHLTDESDYFSVLNVKNKLIPRDTLGRGIVNNDGVHEFQTASIVDENTNMNKFIMDKLTIVKQNNDMEAKKIPELPDQVTYDLIKDSITTLRKLPVGVFRESLDIVKYNFLEYPSTTIASNKLENINDFISSLVTVLKNIKNCNTLFIDVNKILPSIKDKIINYYDSDLENIFDKISDFVDRQENKNTILIIYGVNKLKSLFSDTKKIENLFNKSKTLENFNLILCDGAKKLKEIDYDSWYTNIKNNTDGIWIGKGFGDQSVFRINRLTREMNNNYKNDYAYCVTESDAELMKVISFDAKKDDGGVDE